MASENNCNLPRDGHASILQYAKMQDDEGHRHNHLKAWREFRRLTQKELADQVETTGSVISLLESGDRKLSPKWLRRLAPALKTTPGMILEHNPNDIPADVLDAWAEIPEEKRSDAMAMLRALARAAG
jgi:transcriptional regulator with XRE-family HTH domain